MSLYEDELPKVRCRKPIEGGVLAWPCQLRKDHDGPCAALEIPVSMKRREAWEQQQKLASAQEPSTPPVVPKIDMDALGRLISHRNEVDNPPSSGDGEVVPPPAPPVGYPVLPADAVTEGKVRLDGIVKHLAGQTPDSMPTPVQSWIMGLLAQTSLIVLLDLSSIEFAKGAEGVVLTPAMIDKLVPQQLRVYLGRQ